MAMGFEMAVHGTCRRRFCCSFVVAMGVCFSGFSGSPSPALLPFMLPGLAGRGIGSGDWWVGSFWVGTLGRRR